VILETRVLLLTQARRASILQILTSRLHGTCTRAQPARSWPTDCRACDRACEQQLALHLRVCEDAPRQNVLVRRNTACSHATRPAQRDTRPLARGAGGEVEDAEGEGAVTVDVDGDKSRIAEVLLRVRLRDELPCAAWRSALHNVQ
jgi:hypothetical protein